MGENGIGTALKAWREQEGLTLDEGSRKLKVDRSTLWRWENDVSTPMPAQQKRIDRVLRKAGVVA